MKLRRPAIIGNPSKSKSIEIMWNLPVKLDVLSDQALARRNIRQLAEPILDAAAALACAKGAWYGQDDISPILAEIEDSFRLVSSKLFEDPYTLEPEETEDQQRRIRANQCVGYILDLIDKRYMDMEGKAA